MGKLNRLSYPKFFPKFGPKFLDKFVRDGEGLVSLPFPPVRDKLLLWANGQLQDGADVWQDPDAVQDPDAPFGVWRKDKQIIPVEYSMKTSHSHCLTLDGTNGAHIQAHDYEGDFTFSFGCNSVGTAGSYTVLGAWSAATDVVILDHTLGHVRIKIDNVAYLFDQIVNTWNSYTVTRVGVDVTVAAGGESQTIAASTGVVSISAIGITNSVAGFRGQLWNIELVDDDADYSVTYTMSEGSGTVVHSTDGYASDTILGTLWDEYQDYYHYNVTRGFWMNGDDVKYPYPVSGFTSVHPSGKWNGAESKYQYRDEPELVTADLLEGEFFFTAGVVTPRTQAEIEAYCIGKASVFFCVERGLKQYGEILVGQEFIDAQDDCPGIYWNEERTAYWNQERTNLWDTPRNTEI